MDRWRSARDPLSGQRRQHLCAVGLAGVLLALAGCQSLFHSVTYFDPNTYQALTYTKPIVARLYDSFTEDRVDTRQVEDVRLRLEQMREYEVGKGIADLVIDGLLKLV